MLRLRRKPKTNATQPDVRFRKCDICRKKGTPKGSFPLHRPDCCKPILACSSHSKREILDKFRQLRMQCPTHSKARTPEVDFLDPG